PRGLNHGIRAACNESSTLSHDMARRHHLAWSRPKRPFFPKVQRMKVETYVSHPTEKLRAKGSHHKPPDPRVPRGPTGSYACARADAPRGTINALLRARAHHRPRDDAICGWRELRRNRALLAWKDPRRRKGRFALSRRRELRLARRDREVDDRE